MSRTSSRAQSPVQRTPLPKFQLSLVLLIQISEPITAQVIYPFIINIVRSTGITQGDEKKTGYYAGIIESIFFLAECATVYYWGRLSDTHGRRPILLLGPLGLAIAMLGFGLSKLFGLLVIFRTLQGVFNGNIGVSRTLMAEITDSTNRADAFTLVPIMWSLGCTIGPTLGGVLAEPAARWPQVFGKVAFFHNFPYFLPCAAAGLLSLIAFVLSYFGLKESAPILDIKRRSEDASQSEESARLLSDVADSQSNYGTTAPNAPQIDEPPARPLSTRELLTGDLRVIIFNYGLLSFTDMSYSVLIPLVYSTSIPVGGLGLSPYQIGLILGIFGFFNGFWNLLVLKRFLKKLGPRKMYILTYSSFPLTFVLLWLLRVIAKQAGRVNSLVWALLVLQLFVATLVNTAFSAMSLLVVESAPPQALGAVNGLAQMTASGVRGLAPLLASSLFSASLESRIAGGHLVDILLIILSLMGVVCSLRLPKHDD